MKDDDFYKLAAQVQALEMVIKSMIAVQLSSLVKDEAGFSKVAELASEMAQRLQEHIATIVGQMPASAHQTGFAELTREQMAATVGRCFEQPREMLDQIAKMVLELSKPASDAKN